MKVMDHIEYPKSLKFKDIHSLRYIRSDADAALKAMPEGENSSYYADEICYCSDELYRRYKKISRTFKNDHMQQVYNHYLISDISDNCLSSDRAAYWNGYEGLGSQYPHLLPVRSSISYAIYVAGVDSAKLDKETEND